MTSSPRQRSLRWKGYPLSILVQIIYDCIVHGLLSADTYKNVFVMAVNKVMYIFIFIAVKPSPVVCDFATPHWLQLTGSLLPWIFQARILNRSHFPADLPTQGNIITLAVSPALQHWDFHTGTPGKSIFPIYTCTFIHMYVHSRMLHDTFLFGLSQILIERGTCPKSNNSM